MRAPGMPPSGSGRPFIGFDRSGRPYIIEWRSGIEANLGGSFDAWVAWGAQPDNPKLLRHGVFVLSDDFSGLIVEHAELPA